MFNVIVVLTVATVIIIVGVAIVVLNGFVLIVEEDTRIRNGTNSLVR